jgi:hypothetical protein
LEGVLVAHERGRMLVVSVDAIERSIAINLEGYQIEPLPGR